MKKRPELEDDDSHRHDLELIKAVAQAWHSHSGSSSPTNEFNAHRRNFRGKPSRFKLEAMNKMQDKGIGAANWDFRQSLWDSYEIVTVTKRLEAGLVLDIPFLESGDSSRVHRKRKESKNSLRKLFNRVSSGRFNQANIPGEAVNPF
ncbi:hypothetical protein SLE2022_293140 [Rubroshorea leprosula]